MRYLLIKGCLIAAGMTAGIGLADDKDHDQALQLRETAQVLPLEQILERLGLAPDARLLEVESEYEHGRHVYEIEYLNPDGRIFEAEVDAASGEILKRKEED